MRKLLRRLLVVSVGGFFIALLLAFTSPATPSRAPNGNGTSADQIYVHDSSLGGASSGVPNVTGRIVACDGTTALAYDAVTTHSFTCLAIPSSGKTLGAWGGNTVGVIATGTSFLGGYKPTTAVKFGNVTCSWAVAGAGGTNGVVVRIRNLTDSSTLCTCTLGSCSATASTPLSCSCNTASLAGKQYAIQYDPTGGTGTDCASDPSGTSCTVETIEP